LRTAANRTPKRWREATGPLQVNEAGGAFLVLQAAGKIAGNAREECTGAKALIRKIGDFLDVWLLHVDSPVNPFAFPYRR